MLFFTLIFVFLFIFELLYLKYAALNNIVDTSQGTNAVKAGGIIIIPAILSFLFFFYGQIDTSLTCFITALIVLAVVGLIDDLISLPEVFRLIVQFLAVTLIFWGFNFFSNATFISLLIICIACFLSIGYVNIYNFMDGINGMSFLNSLCSYITFYLVNTFIVQFTSSNLLLIFIIVTVVFGFFNFRKIPKCYLGDVGSIAMGFSILYFAIQLFIVTNNFYVLMLLSVYITDGGWTILERVFKGQNILKPHKMHLYELLVFKLKMPHLKVSWIYFILQIVLSGFAFVALKLDYNSLIGFIIILGLLSLSYFFVKQQVYKNINS